MKVLFTGASSFTGMWFVRELAKAGHTVVATFRRSAGAYADEGRRRRVELALDAAKLLQRLLQVGAFAHHLLGARGVVPQVGVLGLGVQLVEAQRGGIDVKDASSAGPTTDGSRRPPLGFRRAWMLLAKSLVPPARGRQRRNVRGRIGACGP